MTESARPSLPPLVAFLRARLEARDEHRLWLALAIALGAIASAAFTVGTLLYPLDAVQDDARMFLSWMGRWDEPDILRGDFMAGYWEAVTPWAYKLLFHAAWAIGLKPVIFAKILPIFLLLLVPLFSFRLMRAIGAEPIVAFLVTAALLHYAVRTDFVMSATPRGFWPVLVLALLDGLARGKIVQTTVAQLLLTGTYPQMAMTTATVIGMTFLRVSPGLNLDLGRHRLVLVGASAAVTIAGTIPFLLSSGAYAPSFTLAEALTIPTFGINGRGMLAMQSGALDFVCNPRLGFFKDCREAWSLTSAFLILVTVAGPALLFWRARKPGPGLRSDLPLFLLVASLLWFALATAMLFRLHLPNRYTAGVDLLPYLATLALVLERLRDRPFPEWLVRKPLGRVLLTVGTAATLLACAVGAADVRKGISTPDQAFLDAIRALPRTAVVGGFVQQLDFSPVLTNRSTLFSRELAIAYQEGYFLPIMARMEKVKEILLTPDARVLADDIRALGMTHLVAAPKDLAAMTIPRSFRGFFDARTLAAEEEAARARRPLVSDLAGNCTSGVYDGIAVIDAACLVEAAAGRASPPPSAD